MKLQLSLFPTNECEVCHSEVKGNYAVCSIECEIKLNKKDEDKRSTRASENLGY